LQTAGDVVGKVVQELGRPDILVISLVSDMP
jgi:hypothetical protein